MKLYSKKYIFGPIILSIIAFIISPLLNVSHNLIIVDKKDSNTSKSTGDNSILNTIIESFNLNNRAFAECNGYYCLSAPSICVPEGGNINSTIESSYSYYYSNYPVSIDIQSNPDITIAPLTETFNNYPAGPPTDKTVTLTYTGTAPSVSTTDDPGDNSGPYSGKGRKEFNMTTSGFSRYWDGSAWGAEHSNGNASFMISVDHVNNAPTVNTVSPDYSASVANSSTTSNIPVSVSFNDVESNHTNVLLELSSDNFSTTIQSFTQNGVSAGTLVDHTFTNVAPGSYQWRATATETDAVGVCGAAGINLAVSVIRNINLNLPGPSRSNNNTPPSAPSCSSQKPGVPSGFTVVVGPEKGQETLNWFAPQGSVTDYSITYSDNPNTKKWGVVSTGNVTSYVISKLGSGKYYFWVNAVNGCMPGDLVSSSGSTLPPTGPEDIIYIGMLGIVFMIMGTGFWVFSKNK